MHVARGTGLLKPVLHYEDHKESPTVTANSKRNNNQTGRKSEGGVNRRRKKTWGQGEQQSITDPSQICQINDSNMFSNRLLLRSQLLKGDTKISNNTVTHISRAELLQ